MVKNRDGKIIDLRAALDTLQIRQDLLEEQVKALDLDRVSWVSEELFERRLKEKGDLVEKRLKEMYDKTIMEVQDMMNAQGTEAFHDAVDRDVPKEGALNSGPPQAQKEASPVEQQQATQQGGVRSYFGFGVRQQSAPQTPMPQTPIPELGGATSAREMWSREMCQEHMEKHQQHFGEVSPQNRRCTSIALVQSRSCPS